MIKIPRFLVAEVEHVSREEYVTCTYVQSQCERRGLMTQVHLMLWGHKWSPVVLTKTHMPLSADAAAAASAMVSASAPSVYSVQALSLLAEVHMHLACHPPTEVRLCEGVHSQGPGRTGCTVPGEFISQSWPQAAPWSFLVRLCIPRGLNFVLPPALGDFCFPAVLFF